MLSLGFAALGLLLVGLAASLLALSVALSRVRDNAERLARLLDEARRRDQGAEDMFHMEQERTPLRLVPGVREGGE